LRSTDQRPHRLASPRLASPRRVPFPTIIDNTNDHHLHNKNQQIRISGSDFALYELMFRTAPGPTITRPRFLTTMRHAYDFKIAEIDNKSDSRILGLLNRLFDAFDDDQKDEIEWRTWLVM
jgi:hypothetical protein